MPRVLQCVEWDEAAQTCTTEAWVEQPAAFVEYMPTVDQAQTVGVAMFLGLITIAAMSLLLPPRENEE